MHQKDIFSPLDFKEEITKYFKALSIHLRRIYYRINEAEELAERAPSLIAAGEVNQAAQTIDSASVLIVEANNILDYLREKILIPLSCTIAQNAREAQTAYQVDRLTNSINSIYGGMVTCFVLAAHEITLASQRLLRISTILLKEVRVF